jgi:hypothetical protein
LGCTSDSKLSLTKLHPLIEIEEEESRHYQYLARLIVSHIEEWFAVVSKTNLAEVLYHSDFHELCV